MFIVHLMFKIGKANGVDACAKLSWTAKISFFHFSGPKDRVLNFCRTRKPYENLLELQFSCLIWPNILFQNACSNSPCKNNGTCQSGFTKKGYQCFCTSGWTGGQCQDGKLSKNSLNSSN